MKKQSLLLTIVLSLLSTFTIAQEVAKTIIVEHFTNTRCGICANRNPGFYNNLDNQDGVLHLAIHPSSPYPNCVLNNVNPAENDARTNYYGVYGSTPRLVIQGEAISPGADYSDAAIFSPYQNQTTPVSIDIYQSKVGNELTASVVLKAETNNNIGTASLFVAVAEDVVFYDAPNGEDEHYDVFRQTLNGAPEGMTVEVPATAGDSVVITNAITADAGWDFSRLYVMAILQSSADQSVIQAAASDPSDDNPIITSTVEAVLGSITLSPNPVQDMLQVQLEHAPLYNLTLRLYNAAGAELLQKEINGTSAELDVSALPYGAYWLKVTGDVGVYKVIKN